METVAEKRSAKEKEYLTLRKLIFTFLGLGALLVYFGIIYFLLALAIGNTVLAILGVIAIIASLVILYRLGKKFVNLVLS